MCRTPTATAFGLGKVVGVASTRNDAPLRATGEVRLNTLAMWANELARKICGKARTSAVHPSETGTDVNVAVTAPGAELRSQPFGVASVTVPLAVCFGLLSTVVRTPIDVGAVVATSGRRLTNDC